MERTLDNPVFMARYSRFCHRMKDALRRRGELASRLPPISESTFREHSQHHTLVYYEKTIGEIMQYVDELETDKAIENATKSLENVLRTLAAATTTSRDFLSSAATSLNNVARSLTNAANNNSIVFIYDLEEITLMSMNYIDEYLRKFPDVDSSILYVQVENILDRADFLTPEDLHEDDVVNIEDAVLNGTEHMRRLASQYDVIRQLYNQVHKFGLPSTFYVSGDRLLTTNKFNNAVEQIQHHTHQRWQRVRRCLELVNRKSAESSHKNYANVVISGEGVATACAQLLASRQSPFIPIDNVFSTAKLSKDEVFERIRQKFGGDCMLVYVTSPRYSFLHSQPYLRIWPVEAADSIDKLYEAQRDFLLR